MCEGGLFWRKERKASTTVSGVFKIRKIIREEGGERGELVSNDRKRTMPNLLSFIPMGREKGRGSVISFMIGKERNTSPRHREGR